MFISVHPRLVGRVVRLGLCGPVGQCVFSWLSIVGIRADHVRLTFG